MSVSIPKGVFDILPSHSNSEDSWKDSYRWQYVERVIREITKDYGFKEIRTPLFERTELFKRSVGESSDIVTKEMYTFEDKGKRSMTLRPEGTASVMRSLIEKRLHNQLPLQKLFYIAPMFRYERPQAGRFRQHHQFGIEAIGNGAPEQDVEVIDLLYSFYQRLGLKNLTVYLNSVGDNESRTEYRQSLKDYLTPHLSDLSEDSQARFETNPLRILDSKDPKDKAIIKDAPSILDYLNAECKEHFEQVREGLDLLGIPYEINHKLVRGLDYYNKTVFEIVSGELGAQNSIGAGGRYDGLISSLGGPDLQAVGFGTGIERIIQTMIKQEVFFPEAPRPTCFLVPLGDAAKKVCTPLLHNLRSEGIPSEMDYSGRKLKLIMRYADSIQAKYVAVIGDGELEKGIVEMKEMATRESFEIPLSDFKEIGKLLKENLSGEFDGRVLREFQEG
ncbi:MAG: histidyl-tRNA synthetase [Chlamydiales bacterium]|jgi:histidyl-tRNA synthetase